MTIRRAQDRVVKKCNVDIWKDYLKTWQTRMLLEIGFILRAWHYLCKVIPQDSLDNTSCNSKRLASPSCHVSSFNFMPHPNKRIIWDICFLSLAASSHQAKTTDRRSWQVRSVEIWSLKSWRRNNISEPFLLDLLLVCSNIKVDQLLQGPSNHIHKQLDWIIRPLSAPFLFHT